MLKLIQSNILTYGLKNECNILHILHPVEGTGSLKCKTVYVINGT